MPAHRITAANDLSLARTMQRKRTLFFVSVVVAGVLMAALVVFSPTARVLLTELFQHPAGL